METVRYYQRRGLLAEPLLTLRDGMHCRQAQSLAQHKLVDVRAKLNNLKRIESALSGLVRECGRTRGKVSCPLVMAPQLP